MTLWRGRWTAEDRAASVYRYVPFSVPPGAAGVAVELRYDASTAVLDLGLFDADGFRGYSGGARSGFAVTVEAATPGYLPGPLPAGEWRVLVGLHRVPPGGVDAELEIAVGHVEVPEPVGAPLAFPSAVPPGQARDLPAGPGRRWVAGDLHAHTLHSDGALTVDQLAELGARRGLDWLAVTDHNTVSHHPHLAAAGARAGILLVPGQEVTTGTGHANCFGRTGWIDFREPSDAWLTGAEAAGGLLSVNHPLAGDCRWRRPMTRGTPLTEVWHSSWDRRSTQPLEWWAARGGTAIGGSDWHRPGDAEQIGCPTTWVEVDADERSAPGPGGLDVAGVLGALAAGRVAVSAGPDGPVMVPHEDALVVLQATGATLVDGSGRCQAITSERQRVPAGPHPHVLTDGTGQVLSLVAAAPVNGGTAPSRSPKAGA